MSVMGLNIKNDETHATARELARLTGESMTTAVSIAVRERRDRVRAEQGEGLAQRLLEIGRASAGRMPSSSPDSELYDDAGLPR